LRLEEGKRVQPGGIPVKEPSKSRPDDQKKNIARIYQNGLGKGITAEPRAPSMLARKGEEKAIEVDKAEEVPPSKGRKILSTIKCPPYKPQYSFHLFEE